MFILRPKTIGLALIKVKEKQKIRILVLKYILAAARPLGGLGSGD
jgi:hypothetical protein